MAIVPLVGCWFHYNVLHGGCKREHSNVVEGGEEMEKETTAQNGLVTQLRLSEDLTRKIKAYVEFTGTSMNAVVSIALADWLSSRQG